MEAPREYERPKIKAEQLVTKTVHNAFGPKQVWVKVPAPARPDWRAEWLADEPWLTYQLHPNYTKPLGGVADEYDRSWTPDCPVTVQFTVPLLVAMKAGPVPAQLKCRVQALAEDDATAG